MLKQLFCVALLVFALFSCKAQQLWITDSAHTALDASVEATQNASGKKFRLQTKKGYAQLPAPGDYIVRVHSLGYKDIQIGLHVKGDEIIPIMMAAAVQSVDDVVITAQINNRSARSSTLPVKVIDARKVQIMGAQNLRDVLTNEAGIRISQDQILGSSMSLQGISGENVKFLIDGIPMIGRQNGNIDLSQIDMSNVERIEIIEGPMSINYGTNALGGVINIITRKGSDTKSSVQARTYYETIGTYNSGINVNSHLRKLTVQSSVQRNFFDGWRSGESFELIPVAHLADTLRYKTWKPKTQYTGSINLGYKLGKWDFRTATSLFGETLLNRGMPRAPYFENAFDDIFYTRRFDNAVQVTYVNRNEEKWISQLAVNTYQRVKNTYYKDLTTLEQKLTVNAGDQDTTRSHLLNFRSGYVHRSGSFNYETGVDVNSENASGNRIRFNHQSITDAAAFLVVEYNVTDKIILRGGGRAAYNSAFRAPVLPSFNMRWAFTPASVLRLSFAQGFKAPGLKELYFYFVDINHDIVGNPELKPEKSNSINLQYNYIRTHENVLYKAEVKGFYNRISNLITLAQVQGNLYTYENVGLYQTLGMQTSLDVSWHGFKTGVGVNYTGRYNDLTTSYKTPVFSYSPEYRASAGYTFEKLRSTISVFYKYNGSLPVYVLNDKKELTVQSVSAYHWMDATVSTSVTGKWKVGTGVKNIFNVTNINTAVTGGVHSGNGNMPIGTGRFYFLSVNYSLEK